MHSVVTISILHFHKAASFGCHSSGARALGQAAPASPSARQYLHTSSNPERCYAPEPGSAHTRVCLLKPDWDVSPLSGPRGLNVGRGQQQLRSEQARAFTGRRTATPTESNGQEQGGAHSGTPTR